MAGSPTLPAKDAPVELLHLGRLVNVLAFVDVVGVLLGDECGTHDLHKLILLSLFSRATLHAGIAFRRWTRQDVR